MLQKIFSYLPEKLLFLTHNCNCRRKLAKQVQVYPIGAATGPSKEGRTAE